MPLAAGTEVSRVSPTKLRERDSVLATLEILADRDLTERLVKLAKRINSDVRPGRLHTIEEVFGKK